MTREEALAYYQPIRASVRRILTEAVRVCNQSDLKRAAKLLGLWADERIILPEGDQVVEMLSDIALFDPNQRGRRAYDVFLSDKAPKVNPTDSQVAQRMSAAFFSLFRCAGHHEVAGVELEDLLNGGRKLWLMDERMEESAPDAGVFGMRIFDAGLFHVGFGIAAPTDDETAEFTVQSVTRNGRSPFRHSLAATLYGDCISGRTQLAPEIEEAMLESLTTALFSIAPSHNSSIVGRTSRRTRTRKSK
jgi:hypothetical protein